MPSCLQSLLCSLFPFDDPQHERIFIFYCINSPECALYFPSSSYKNHSQTYRVQIHMIQASMTLLNRRIQIRVGTFLRWFLWWKNRFGKTKTRGRVAWDFISCCHWILTPFISVVICWQRSNCNTFNFTDVRVAPAAIVNVESFMVRLMEAVVKRSGEVEGLGVADIVRWFWGCKLLANWRSNVSEEWQGKDAPKRYVGDRIHSVSSLCCPFIGIWRI